MKNIFNIRSIAILSSFFLFLNGTTTSSFALASTKTELQKLVTAYEEQRLVINALSAQVTRLELAPVQNPNEVIEAQKGATIAAALSGIPNLLEDNDFLAFGMGFSYLEASKAFAGAIDTRVQKIRLRLGVGSTKDFGIKGYTIGASTSF